jgi:hypothetical protein
LWDDKTVVFLKNANKKDRDSPMKRRVGKRKRLASLKTARKKKPTGTNTSFVG